MNSAHIVDPRPTGFVKRRGSLALGNSPQVPALVKASLSGLCAGTVFGQIFALRLSDTFSLSFSVILSFTTIGLAALYQMARIDFPSLVLYIFSLVATFLSLSLSTSGDISISSLMYYIVIYMPLIVKCTSNQMTDRLHRETVDLFVRLCYILALMSIFQFSMQFVLTAPWFMNPSLLLPDFIRVAGIWNTAIPLGSHFKANGFFQLEPSGLSLITAFALLIELQKHNRKRYLAILSTSMILSFSGSGMLMLAVAFLTPTRLVGIPRALSILLLGIIFILCVDTFLVDGYFQSRLEEFNTEGSSGYARFIAPTQIVSQSMKTIQGMIFGLGPGTIRPAIREYPSTYEIHDPTWAKLLFEYGILGGGLIFAFVIFVISRSRAPRELKIGMLYAWLAAGGLLLNPMFTGMLMLLISFWPPTYQANFGRGDTFTNG